MIQFGQSFSMTSHLDSCFFDLQRCSWLIQWLQVAHVVLLQKPTRSHTLKNNARVLDVSSQFSLKNIYFHFLSSMNIVAEIQTVGLLLQLGELSRSDGYSFLHLHYSKTEATSFVFFCVLCCKPLHQTKSEWMMIDEGAGASECEKTRSCLKFSLHRLLFVQRQAGVGGPGKKPSSLFPINTLLYSSGSQNVPMQRRH